MLTVTLESNQALHSLQALVDSGSEQNLVDTGLTTQLGIPLTRLEQAIPARALNNRPDLSHHQTRHFSHLR